MNFTEQISMMNPRERKQFLLDNSYKTEEGTYFKKFSLEELDLAKDTFSNEAIALQNKEDEFSDIKKDLSAKIKSKKLEQRGLLKTIKENGEWKKGSTFMMDDQQEGFMYTFDEEGNEVNRRRLRPDEKQTSILSVIREGAGN